MNIISQFISIWYELYIECSNKGPMFYTYIFSCFLTSLP